MHRPGAGVQTCSPAVRRRWRNHLFAVRPQLGMGTTAPGCVCGQSYLCFSIKSRFITFFALLNFAVNRLHCLTMLTLCIAIYSVLTVLNVILWLLLI